MPIEIGLDVSQDFLLFDNSGTVTLIKPSGTHRDFPNSIRRLISTREAFRGGGKSAGDSKAATNSGGDYETAEISFSLSQQYGSVTIIDDVIVERILPEIGDLIQDAYGQWSVVWVDDATLNTRYRCYCKKSELNGPGALPGNILRATWTQDTDGAQYANWNPVGAAITIKIHESGTLTKAEFKKRTKETTHVGYLVANPTLLVTDRILQNGVQYDILKIIGKDTLAALWSLDLRTNLTPSEI